MYRAAVSMSVGTSIGLTRSSCRPTTETDRRHVGVERRTTINHGTECRRRCFSTRSVQVSSSSSSLPASVEISRYTLTYAYSSPRMRWFKESGSPTAMCPKSQSVPVPNPQQHQSNNRTEITPTKTSVNNSVNAFKAFSSVLILEVAEFTGEPPAVNFDHTHQRIGLCIEDADLVAKRAPPAHRYTPPSTYM